MSIFIGIRNAYPITYKLLNFSSFDRAFYTLPESGIRFFFLNARGTFLLLQDQCFEKAFPTVLSFHELVITHLKVLFSLASLKALLSAPTRSFPKV